MKPKARARELPFGRPPKVVLVVTTSLILITLISIYHPFEYQQPDYQSPEISSHNPPPPPSPPPPPPVTQVTVRDKNVVDPVVVDTDTTGANNKECDIFSGEWVPDPSAPYYTNETCMAIHEHQNCMKYGRPDSGFMKWRWKPFGCELPLFEPTQFLKIVRGKFMAFVGDSLARNHVQSLICLLSRVEYPKDISYTSDERFKRWNYVTHNFTLAMFTSPHLVKANQSDPDGPAHSGIFNLYLDEADEQWITQVDELDYLIISGGHWFFRSLIFYEKQRRVGCHLCQLKNVPYLSNFHGFRKALGTVFGAINSRKNYKGITYLRTLSPSHFEGGLWNAGGDCVRTKPSSRNETTLGGEETELYAIQKEEFRKAKAEGRKRGLKYRLLDTTQALLLRPDGHPSKYGHPPNEKWYNDCVHWCLPGPVDAWSNFLLEMMKIEGRISREEK
ncbi:hypothetical protein CDL15_Pgr027470 [Punica granatum]|uniref:Uncharacterized protein n=1 Tax=Punica granatum TaxID=22663 RepID=A0A218XIB6_PUNGR|nr:hypothetical protein CDL15_Pgr027470 [Punica granatum]